MMGDPRKAKLEHQCPFPRPPTDSCPTGICWASLFMEASIRCVLFALLIILLLLGSTVPHAPRWLTEHPHLSFSRNASDRFIFKYLKNWLQMELCSPAASPGIFPMTYVGVLQTPVGSSTVLVDICVLDQHTESFKLTRELILRKASYSAELKPEFDISEQL